MINKRDSIYYDYRFLDIKHKKWYWSLYCKIRKFIALGESPSKVGLWALEYEITDYINKGESND